MKHSALKLIVWSVIALLVASFMLMLFIKPDLLSGVDFHIPTYSVTTYEDAERYTAGDGAVRGVSALDIHWTDGSVTLRAGDGDQVLFEERSSGALSEEQRLHWLLEDGTLCIRPAASGVQGPLSQKHLTVTVPRTLVLRELGLDGVSCELRVEALEAEELELSCVSGDVLLEGVRLRELELDSISGRVEATGLSCSSLTLRTVSGTADIAFSGDAQPRSIDADTTSGRVTLTLPRELGFSVSLQSVSGELICDFEGRAQGKGSFVSGDGALEIEMDSVSADLRIREG